MHRSIKFGLYGLVLAGLLGGTAGLGDRRQVRRPADRRPGPAGAHHRRQTSRACSQAAHVTVGAHDLVAPDLAARSATARQIVVRRGHLLHLSVNGEARDVWVNADSVDEALSQLGYGSRRPGLGVAVQAAGRRGDRACRSARRSTSPSRSAARRCAVLSAGPTVYQALGDGGIYAGPATTGSRCPAPARSPTARSITDPAGQLPAPARSRSTCRSAPSSRTTRPATSAPTRWSRPARTASARSPTSCVYVDGKLAGRVPMATAVLSPAVEPAVTKVGTKQPCRSVPPCRPAPPSRSPPAWSRPAAGAATSSAAWSACGTRRAAGVPTPPTPPAPTASRRRCRAARWPRPAPTGRPAPRTQITWGLNYIAGVYGTPCAAWAHSQATNWY